MDEKNIEFDANWFKLNKWLDAAIEGRFFPFFVKFANEFGNEIREHVRKHILAQDLDWAPLADRTKRRKGHPHAYIETGFYLQNIAVEVQTTANYDIDLTVRPTGVHPTNGKRLQDVAEILETGSARIPARPLWRAVKNEMWNYSTILTTDFSEAFR